LFHFRDVLCQTFFRPVIGPDGWQYVYTNPAASYGQPAGPEAVTLVYDNWHNRKPRGQRQVSESLFEWLQLSLP